LRIASVDASGQNPAFVATQSQHAERRWGARIEVDLPVRLELSQGRKVAARMRNASVSGALIECPLELPVFTPLRVEIPESPQLAHGTIVLAARVVRAETPCLGVEWRGDAAQVLENLLHEMGGSPVPA
jgi:PilZ domain-containing protein